MEEVRHRRSKQSIEHCRYPSVYRTRANAMLRPKKYCSFPKDPEALTKTQCMEKNGEWLLRNHNKKINKTLRRKGYCRSKPMEVPDLSIPSDIVRKSHYEPYYPTRVEPKDAGINWNPLDLGRKQKRASKRKFYPKTKKSCVKRHMKWNSKSKHCKKSN